MQSAVGPRGICRTAVRGTSRRWMCSGSQTARRDKEAGFGTGGSYTGGSNEFGLVSKAAGRNVQPRKHRVLGTTGES